MPFTMLYTGQFNAETDAFSYGVQSMKETDERSGSVVTSVRLGIEGLTAAAGLLCCVHEQYT